MSDPTGINPHHSSHSAYKPYHVQGVERAKNACAHYLDMVRRIKTADVHTRDTYQQYLDQLVVECEAWLDAPNHETVTELKDRVATYIGYVAGWLVEQGRHR